MLTNNGKLSRNAVARWRHGRKLALRGSEAPWSGMRGLRKSANEVHEVPTTWTSMLQLHPNTPGAMSIRWAVRRSADEFRRAKGIHIAGRGRCK